MAFAYAYKQNRAAVCANGNYQQLYPNQTYYPAGFGQGIIAVGATNANDQVWNSSQVNNAIDVSAPGVSIYSTYRNPDYQYQSGTSMATPHVSGIASLLKGYNSNLYNDDIEHIIQLSADDITTYPATTGWDQYTGYGRVNARKALNLLRPPLALTQATTTGGTDQGASSEYQMYIYGAQSYGLQDGLYIVKRHEVRKTIFYSANSWRAVWGRGVATNGWSMANPNFSMGWCDVVPGTVTSTSAQLKTYVYEVWDILRRSFGWKPTTPGNVTFAYTALSLPNTITANGTLDGNFVLDNNVNSKQWSNPHDYPRIGYILFK